MRTKICQNEALAIPYHADNFLQAETDAHTKRATKDGEGGQIDPDAVNRDENGREDQCDLQELGEQDLHGRSQVRELCNLSRNDPFYHT